MKHLIDIIKKIKILGVIYILLGVVLAFLNSLSAIYFKKLLDGFGNKNLTIYIIGIYALILIAICTINYFDEYPSNKLSESIYLQFKLKAMTKMSTIDYINYQSLGNGNLVQRIENGANSGKSILFNFYFRLFRELIPNTVFSLIYITSIDKNIMIYIVVGYVLVFVVTNILLKYLYSIKERILNSEEIFNKYLIRSLTEMVVFRINKRFDYEINKATNAAEEIVESKSKMKMIHEAFFAIFALFITVIKVVIILISWKGSSLTVGSLVALLTLVDMAYSPVAIFNVLFVQYKLDKSSFKRYTDLLDMQNDSHLNSGKEISSIKGDIRFEKVNFSYDERKIFEKISFEIPCKSAVAFVGESGSGKSTIVKQIMGLIKPDDGQIYIDEYELSELNLNQFYNHACYIPQESPIISGTLRENITFDKKVTDEEIIQVLDLVGLTSFYYSLPNGLNTEVGERGIMISGGERQRLALARIYFMNAEIIILDEATSAMDNATEDLVMKNLLRFLKDKTVIVIAHRLNTIKDFEKIFVFKKGQIVGQGKFDVLVEQNEYFRRLCLKSHQLAI